MQQISEKIVAGLPTPAKGNKVHFFSGVTLGLGAPLGSARRVLFDTSDSNAQYIVSSVDSVEFQARDSRYVDVLPVGQKPGTKKVVIFSHIG